MLNQEVIKQADALEIHLCKELDKCEIFPMNEEDSEMLIKLLFINRKDFEETCVKDLKDTWQFQVLVKRTDLCLTANFDKRVLFFIMLVSDGVMGNMMMYLYYTQYKCKQRGIKDIDLQEFCEIFPRGFFDDKDLSRIWDDCKVDIRGDKNLIDFGTASLSIQFEDLIVKQESEEQTEPTTN